MARHINSLLLIFIMNIIPKHKDGHKPVSVLDSNKHIKVSKWDEKLIVDPKGYFMIKVENGNIYAGRVNNKNVMTDVLYGKGAEDIYQELIKRKWVSRLDHAAYLGKELARAEYCLKNNKNFIQE